MLTYPSMQKHGQTGETSTAAWNGTKATTANMELQLLDYISMFSVTVIVTWISNAFKTPKAVHTSINNSIDKNELSVCCVYVMGECERMH